MGLGLLCALVGTLASFTIASRISLLTLYQVITMSLITIALIARIVNRTFKFRPI
jgi:hypothetical protein